MKCALTVHTEVDLENIGYISNLGPHMKATQVWCGKFWIWVAIACSVKVAQVSIWLPLMNFKAVDWHHVSIAQNLPTKRKSGQYLSSQAIQESAKCNSLFLNAYFRHSKRALWTDQFSVNILLYFNSQVIFTLMCLAAILINLNPTIKTNSTLKKKTKNAFNYRKHLLWHHTNVQ